MALTGYGNTITFASGFFAEIRNISLSAEAETIITSHTTTPKPYHTRIPVDLADPGDFTVDILFDPGTHIPLLEPAEAVTINWKDGSTWSSVASITAYSIEAPYDDLMTATITLTLEQGWVETPSVTT